MILQERGHTASVIFDRWDLVVPIPFSEGQGEKRHPALLLPSWAFNRAGHTILSMITTREHRPWPGDIDIEDYRAAGLPSPCLCRLKVFTLDNRLILRRLGRLTQPKVASIEQGFSRYLL